MRQGALTWRVVAALLVGAATATGCARDGAAAGNGAAAGASAEPPRSPDTLATAVRASAGGWIYFVGERGTQKRLHRVRPTGGAAELLTTGSWDEFPSALSADRRRLLVVASRDTMGAHFERVAVLEPDAGPARPHSAWTGRARNPSWSPDGRAFVMESDAESFGDLFLVAVGEPGKGRRLTRTTHGSFEPAVSPDGREIAFVSSRQGNADLYLIRSDGSGERRLTASPRDSWAPAWSPDGQWIAFLSSREGRDRAYVVRRDGTHLRPLVSAAPADVLVPAGEGALAWSPDGREIAMLRMPRGGETRLWIVPFDGAPPRAISPPGTSAGEASWSPDGRLIAYSVGRPDAPATLVVARPDGGAVTRIAGDGMSAWLPRWGR